MVYWPEKKSKQYIFNAPVKQTATCLDEIQIHSTSQTPNVALALYFAIQW